MTEEARRDLSLWGGLLMGPFVWFLSLEAKFALAPWVCVYGWKPAVFAVSAAALATTAAAGVLSWREWKRAGTEHASRSGAMALAGMMTSIGFLIVLVAQSLPELILAGCE